MELGTQRRRLVVAVHDVMDGTLPGVRKVLSDLDRIGVNRRTLLVVPGGARPLREAPEVQGLLATEARHGGELLAHGWTHRAPGRARGSIPTRVRAFLFAHGVAEFAGLDPSDATLAAGMARDELAMAGFDVEGFCAPAWLEAPWVTDALRAAGYRFKVGMASLTDLRSGRRLPLGWQGYIGAGALQEALVATAARALAAMPGRPPTAQVFLHPQGDLQGRSYRAAIRHVERLLDQDTQLVQFRDLV